MTFNALGLILAAIASAIATALIAWVLHSWDVSLIEERHTAALSKQKTELQNECLLGHKITGGVSNDYQAGLNDRDNDLSYLLRQDMPTCVNITSTSPGGSDAANQQHKPGQRNAVDSRRLYSFSGSCETDRLKVIGLQEFIRKTWAANGQ